MDLIRKQVRNYMKTQERFEQSPEGYLQAKEWLISIGEWERISNSGFSTDGYSIVAAANDIHSSGNWMKLEYRNFLEKCCDLLDWDKKQVHNMKCTNFWLFGYLEDFKTPEAAVEIFKQKRVEYGEGFPPKPETIPLSPVDSAQLLHYIDNPPPMGEGLKKVIQNI